MVKKLVIFEGPDGVGKSYLVDKYIKEHPEFKLYATPYLFRNEAKTDKTMSDFTRQVLCGVSHYDLIDEYEKHDYIIQDRSFISSLAYYQLLSDADDPKHLMLMDIYSPLVKYLKDNVDKVEINVVNRAAPVKRYFDEVADVMLFDIEKWKQIYYMLLINARKLTLYKNFSLNIIMNDFIEDD